MPLQLDFTRHPDHVLLTVQGEATMPNFVSLVETTERETLFWSDRRLLVDLRAIEGRLTDDEQVFLGELTAQNLAHLDRLASVVAPDQLTRNSEGAARRLGMRMRVFDKLEEAQAWIREPEEETGFVGSSADGGVSVWPRG